MLPHTDRKYERIPEDDEANFVILSIKTYDRIRPYRLNRYAIAPPENIRESNGIYIGSQNQDEDQYLGDSTTVLWSGTQGNNTPLRLYGAQDEINNYTGYVCNPDLLSVEQADFLAYSSNGQLSAEGRKRDLGGNFKASKYENKRGWIRPGIPGFGTNIAKFQKLPGSTRENPLSVYHGEGSLETVAANVWRKFFKRNHREFNEAITYRNSDLNPVDGLLLVVNRTRTITEPVKREFLIILLGNRNLKLYLYHDQANEHIIRVMCNMQAQIYLSSRSTQNLLDVFNQAHPFRCCFSILRLEEYMNIRAANRNEYTGLASSFRCLPRISNKHSRLAKLRAATALRDLALDYIPSTVAAQIVRLKTQHPALNNGRLKTYLDEFQKSISWCSNIPPIASERGGGGGNAPLL